MNDESTPKGAHESATTALMVQPTTDSRQEARRRLDQIKLLLGSMTDQANEVQAILDEARTSKDHLALGYQSWTAYMLGEYAGLLAELKSGNRREVVSSLTAAGMSTRAIAGVVGTSQKTVVKDLQSQVIPEVSPGDDLAYPFECGSHCSHSPICQRVKKTPQKITETKCDVEGHEDHVDRRVTGLDGKSYPVPPKPVVEPKKPRRPALPDQFRTAVWNLDKAIRRLEVIAADDRFDPDQETYRHHEPLLREHLNKLTNIFGAYLSDGDRRVVDEVLRGSR